MVTSFEYRLHPVSPVLGGGLAWPLERARQVLAFYDEFARGCPDELSVNAGFGLAPDGTPVLGVGVAWFGDLDMGERLLKPLRLCEPVLVDGIARMSYVDLQSGGDAGFPNCRRQYWKGGFLRRLGPDAVRRAGPLRRHASFDPYADRAPADAWSRGAGEGDGDVLRAPSRPVGLSHPLAVGRRCRR